MAQDWLQSMNRGRQRTQQAQQPASQAPQFSNQNMASYMQGGNMAGAWGGANNQNAYAGLQGNMASSMDIKGKEYEDYMKGLMGQSPVQTWQNPYQGQMNQTLQNMGNAPSTQQSANSWMNQYMPMMQQGGQMGNPQLQQTQMNPNAQNFMNGQSQTNQYANPSLGVGGDIATRIAQMNQPQTGGVSGQNGQTAGNAWLQGLLGLQSAPGLSDVEVQRMASGALDPLQNRLNQQQDKNLSGLSFRGLGRSGAVTATMRDTNQVLGDAGASVLGNLAGQNAQMKNSNRLSALQGLGQAQGQFTGQGQADQQLAQNWAMNQGQLGMGLAGLNQQGQLATNQLNQGASNDAFNQNATRAGMGLDLYNSDANRALQQQSGDRNYQGMLADNQYRNASMGNSNLMSLLGMGANAGQQDFANQQGLLSSLLGAGNQSQNAWSTNQGNLLSQLGMQGNMANSLYGNQRNAYMSDRDFMEQQRLGNIGLHRQQEQADASGGIGGLLGQVGGTLLGSALGPIGAGIGGSISSSLFGGGQQQQSPYGQQFMQNLQSNTPQQNYYNYTPRF